MSEPREVDLVIKGGTVVSPSGTRKVGVAVDGGKVVAVTADEFQLLALLATPILRDLNPPHG